MDINTQVSKVLTVNWQTFDLGVGTKSAYNLLYDGFNKALVLGGI